MGIRESSIWGYLTLMLIVLFAISVLFIVGFSTLTLIILFLRIAIHGFNLSMVNSVPYDLVMIFLSPDVDIGIKFIFGIGIILLGTYVIHLTSDSSVKFKMEG